MSALGWHVVMRRSIDTVIAPTTGDVRTTMRTTLAIGRRHGLFLASAPDTHLHVALRCERRAAGRFARDLETALCKHLGTGAGWAPASIWPIRDQGHRRNLLRYITTNPAHHGMGADPWLERTTLPDLLGARVCGTYTASRVRTWLPRTTRARLLELSGLDALDDQPCAEHLVDAAASALGLPHLSGRSTAAVRGRTAVIALSRPLGWSTPHAAIALGISRSSAHRLGQAPADPALLRAIGLQCDLRRRLGTVSADFSARAPTAPMVTAEAPLLYLAA